MTRKNCDRRNLATISEAAAYLGVPIGTVRYWVHLKRLPSFKVGRRRLLDVADLARFLESCREEAV